MTLFRDYPLGTPFDEVLDRTGTVRSHYERLVDRLEAFPAEVRIQRQRAAELFFLNRGTTFTVYKEEAGIDRIFPFDSVPRLVPAEEWERLEAGLKQRVYALNLFLYDLYHEQKILKDGIIPIELIYEARHFRREWMQVPVPRDIYVHVCGTDLVRDRDGTYCVLEDNLRCPSGVSYVLENRLMMQRIYPELFDGHDVRPVQEYCRNLRDVLRYIAAPIADEPTAVL
ncbi:MAG: circularly permuted type 2 ATP-grasp protein, partial [Armatimonadetes bacterium]|nr:circularly permuted type 2 ATP-grasp protein [Armatimonadota bacterium]